MIGRRSKRDQPQASAPSGRFTAPTTPAAPGSPPGSGADALTIEQPVVGAREVEPSAQVLEELLTFFGVRHGHHAGSANADALPPPAAVATTASTRVIEPEEMAAAVPVLPPVLPPSDPSSGDELVAAPTRRSTRRSLREARREEKRAAKRLARHAKEQAKADAKAKRKDKRKDKGKDKGKDQDQATGQRTPPSKDGGSGATVAAGGIDPPGGTSAVAPAADGGAPGTTADDIDAVEGVRIVAGPVAARSTVTIVDDGELPDTVYLQGQLDSGAATASERAIVFIDDKDPVTGSVISIDAASSTGIGGRIEPRLRDRRIAVKRAVGRKRLKWAALAIDAVGVVVAALAVLGSGVFDITSIRVEGVVYSGGPAMDVVLADLEGSNVLRTDTSEFERRLEAIPWVSDARVTTAFPNGATVEILEREPVISYPAADGEFRVLDQRGRVLDITAGQPVAYLLLDVEPGTGPNLDPGAFAPAGFRAAATLVSALGAPLSQQVESISSVPDGSDLRLTLDTGIEVRFGAAEDLVDKLVRLQTALTDTNPEHLPTTMIDVSTRDIVVN